MILDLTTQYFMKELNQKIRYSIYLKKDEL